ncbi:MULTISPECIES: site-specific DNA-methyltransferase [Pseudomonas]|uniref:site-specific DNA-methyltransferase n=1 Tax=Pseudomonas TaxID=286 RepID=UPI0008592C89|nr:MULTISPECIES: site-specific DNA-methyltransferase [Pseudomonas]NWL06165.1 site-specific DNA-methyltransferase [Pseudomonas hunanensis]
MNKPALERVTLQDGESANVVNDNIEQLKNLLPEAFGEGGVNFDTLRQLLGDAGVIDEGEEKYGLNWHGKKKARQIALTPSTGTLLPCPSESIDWNTTKNIFIEGDNLEVLKLLQKSYAGKVKMIFIDPPYNTGNEFIYPDNYQDNLDTYLQYTGQKSSEGLKLSSNAEGSGRFHTNWLNMMYPRLKLAKSLLRNDGAIFISIDDNEVPRLRMLCDEVFGEENFITNIIWQHSVQPKGYSGIFSVHHNHILMYRKSEDFELMSLERTEEDNKAYANPDNDPKGDWRTGDVRNALDRKNLKYPITTPSGKIINPPDNGWRWSRETLNSKIDTGEIFFSEDETRIIRKIYLADLDGRTPETIWFAKDSGTTRSGVKELKGTFDGDAPFDTVKPTELIKRMMKVSGVKADDIVLDFFAGSGSTGAAVLDVEQPRFILVQLPEAIDESKPHGITARKLGLLNISDVTKERLRRCTAGKATPNSGFKVFKLSSSNIRAWRPDRKDLEQTLLSHQEHLIDGRTEQDVLYELLVKRGVDLAVPIESRVVAGKEIFSIGYGVLFACLDPSITRADVENVAQGMLAWHGELNPLSDTHVFFRDSAFSDDIAKTNMAAILEQHGISHVRSL